MATANQTPTAEFAVTTKSGIDLGSFEKVELFKKYPKPQPVTSVADALARLGNDQTRLLKILDAGLQSEAGKIARDEDSGWMVYDEDGKETTTLYDGTLVSNEILNPTVLNFARLMETAVIRDGKEVMITWDDCKNADEKRACKANAVAQIAAQPAMVAALKKKMAAATQAQS